MRRAPSRLLLGWRRAGGRPRRGLAWLGWCFALALVVGVAILYGPSRHYAFTNYDEEAQVVINPFVRSLDADNLATIFTSFTLTSYYPIRLLSFAIDFHFWHLNATGYHLTNLALHAVNVLLVFALFLRLQRGLDLSGTGELAPSQNASESSLVRAASSGADLPLLLGGLLAAGLFAFHPVVVEPVVWIAGREELLMVLFALLAMHAHMMARPVSGQTLPLRRAICWHAVTAVCMALACMSNVVAAIIPMLIVAYDLAMVHRLRWQQVMTGTWFLFLIAVGTYVLKQIGEARAEEMGSATVMKLPPVTRILTVALTYGLNIKHLVWPDALAVTYPNEAGKSPLAPWVLFGIVCVAGTLVLFWLLRRRRLALFGLLWFVFALAPSSQIITHHIFRADRFLYMPLVGLGVLIGGACTALLRRRGRAARAVGVAIMLVLVPLAVRSRRYLPVWQNSLTLWSHVVAMPSPTTRALNNMGITLGRLGRSAEAEPYLRRALEEDPDFVEARVNLGNSLGAQGKLSEALPLFEEAAKRAPKDLSAQYNYGRCLFEMGLYSRALEALSHAAAIDPDDADTQNLLAETLTRLGRRQDAITADHKVLEIDPNRLEARYRLGCNLERIGKLTAAIDAYEVVMKTNPGYKDVVKRLAAAEAKRHEHKTVP